MKNENQQIDPALEAFKAFVMSPEGKQSLNDALDEWFTMGEISEQVDEEYPNCTDEEFINECLKRYEKIYALDEAGRTLWIETLNDMLTKCS